MASVRRAGILLVVAALAVASVGGIAGAKKQQKRKGRSWPSHVTLVQTSSTTFTGRATSKLKACRGYRVVTLFYRDPNNGQTSPLSVQRTDGAGRYKVTLTTAAYAGNYHAEVSKRRIRAMKAPQTCRATQSATVGV